MEEDCIEDVDAFGGGSIMVWGGISEGGKTELVIVIVRGGLTGERYVVDILKPQVLPYEAAVGDEFILMDDNATPHRSRVDRDFLEEKVIEQIEWSSKSPDMNPIEPLWDVLKRKVNKKIKDNTTIHQLERLIVRAWEGIDQQTI